MVKKVIVTGAAGFLGRRLLPRLVELGFHVVAVDRVSFSTTSENVERIQSDLLDAAEIFARGSSPDAIIHLAWDMRRDVTNFALQAEQVRRTACLLDEAVAAGVRRFIMMGSAEEYGRRGGCIAEDDAPVGTLSPYGWAKRACGEMARAKAEISGAGLLWLRPFIVYGPGQQGDMAIPNALRAAREGSRAEFSDATQRRDFVFVDDVVNAILAGLAMREPIVETVNIGSGTPVALREVLEAVRMRWGQDSSFVFGARPRRAGEPDEQYANISKASSVLGWRPSVAWRQGIECLVEANG